MAARVPGRSIVRPLVTSILRHGGKLHRRGIINLIKNGKGHGVLWEHMRVNRTIIHPNTGISLSRRRPDFAGMIPGRPVKLVLGESAVSQSVRAARRKLLKMAEEIRRKAPEIEVILLPVESVAGG